MKIDKTTVDRLAELAKLEFDEKSKEAMVNDLNRIVSFIEKLKEIPTDDVEPLIYMTDEVNVLRDDVVEQTISHEEALLNAPKKDSDYFKVPKVLEKK